MSQGSVVAKAVIFDLDEVLLDMRRAWQYTVEEAVASVCGRRESAAPLVEEYWRRPWRDALGILVREIEERDRCEALCLRMYERSAMKRLLVHEGVGMGLDRIRASRIEMGAISRAPHGPALRRIESTGLDRFLAVLSPTAAGEPWDVGERLRECLAFLRYEPWQCAFVGADGQDLRVAEAQGLRPFEAQWTATGPTGYPAVPSPGALVESLAGAPETKNR